MIFLLYNALRYSTSLLEKNAEKLYDPAIDGLFKVVNSVKIVWDKIFLKVA